MVGPIMHGINTIYYIQAALTAYSTAIALASLVHQNKAKHKEYFQFLLYFMKWKVLQILGLFSNTMTKLYGYDRMTMV